MFNLASLMEDLKEKKHILSSGKYTNKPLVSGVGWKMISHFKTQYTSFKNINDYLF